MDISNITNNKTKFNPWEDQKTFIQDVGGFSDFITFLSNNQISNNNKNVLYDPFPNENEYNAALETIDLCNSLDNLTSVQYEKLSQLEILYEKYKYQLLLSRDKKNELMTKIHDLTQTFALFEQNKIKLATLIHNASISDTSTIKIKHSKKFELINILKICSNQYSSLIDLVEFSAEMHQETINKIVSQILC